MFGWAINTQYVNIPQLVRQNALPIGTKGFFSIDSDLNVIDMKKNSHFLLIKPHKSDFLFTNSGIVNKQTGTDILKPNSEAIEKARKNNRPIPKDRYRHSYEYSIDRVLNNNNNLNDLKYSLTAVDNFGKPQVHFQQQFRQIKDIDFETIVEGYVYASRTVFGKLVNSIPRQNKLEFMLQAMEKFKTIDFAKIPLILGIDFLNDYLNRRILSRGKILVATDNLISNKLNDLLNKNETGFINEETGVEKNLKEQANIFKQIIELQKNINFLDLVRETINENAELEQHFYKIFKKQTWPIDLRT